MDATDRKELPVTNQGILRSLDPREAARTICHLCHDCGNCPANEGTIVYDMEACRGKLAGWLQAPKDERFWKYLLERGGQG